MNLNISQCHGMEGELYIVRLGSEKHLLSCVKNLRDVSRPLRPNIIPYCLKEESRFPALIYLHLQGAVGLKDKRKRPVHLFYFFIIIFL